MKNLGKGFDSSSFLAAVVTSSLALNAKLVILYIQE